MLKISSASILLLTERGDLAADLLVLELRARGVPYKRVNLDDYPRQLTITVTEDRMQFVHLGRIFDFAEFGSAWFRKMPIEAFQAADSSADSHYVREWIGFLRGAFEIAPWRWVNEPGAVERAALKLKQLDYARSLGMRIPRTASGNDPEVLREFLGDVGTAVVKLVSGGRVWIEGVQFMPFTASVSERDLVLKESAVQMLPGTYQERIRKTADVRTFLIGERAFSIRVTTPDHYVDWRQAPEADVFAEWVPSDANYVRQCRAMLAKYRLRYGAFDAVEDQTGELVFLELNASGQWGYFERLCGAPLTAALVAELHQSCA